MFKQVSANIAAQKQAGLFEEGPEEFALVSQDKKGESVTPHFLVDGQVYGLASMLEANRDDKELCKWLISASVGEEFPSFVGCKCVA